jgi:exopolysaccharide production protein ExoZ
MTASVHRYALLDAQTGKLEWVQALRGIAALMVVICHTRSNLAGTRLDAFATAFMLPGAMGVDLFFLVSGFIMVYTTRRSDGSVHDALDFMAKRFARVWPVYAVLSTLYLVIAAYPHVASMPWPDIGRGLLFLPVDARKPPYYSQPFGLGWTLNFEMYFYLVFALSMLAGRWRWLAFYGWMVVMLVAVPLLATGHVSFNPKHDYKLGVDVFDQAANPVIWDFVAGTAIGLLYGSRIRVDRMWLSYILIAVSLAFIAWRASPGHIEFHGILHWGGPLAIFVAALALTFKGLEPRAPRLLVWLGSISFSLYLVHVPVLIQFERLADVAGYGPWIKTPVFVVLFIFAALIAAGISRRLLERGLSEFVRSALLRLIEAYRTARLPP